MPLSPRVPDVIVGGHYGFNSRCFHIRGVTRALIQTMGGRQRLTNEDPFDCSGTSISSRC